MNNWWQRFASESIFYITPDVKRGIGLEGTLPNYHIISSFYDPIIPVLRTQGTNIFCLEEIRKEDSQKISNSGRLLEHPLVSKYINKYSPNTPYIAYFKPSVKLDILIKKKGYLAAGNTAELNELFENKINFYALVWKHFPQFAISSEVGILGKVNFKKLAKKLGLPFVIQFGHGWAGKTTFFISSEEEFIELVKKFKSTKVKISRKINGFTILNNCCIYKKSIFVSPPAIQLSGIKELHEKPGVTCGRQWPAIFLDIKQIRLINNVSCKLGRIMQRSGFKGFFGLDFLIEKESGKIYLSEVNARFTASTPFFTYLERSKGIVPLLAYHFGEFMHKVLPAQYENPEGIVGSQIIFRSSRFKPLISSYPGFGVYKVIDNRPKFIRNNYHPEELSDREYIFIGRLPQYQSRFNRDGNGVSPRLSEEKPRTLVRGGLPKKYETNNEEMARIEVKQEVLETPNELKSWLVQLIS